MRRIPPGRRRLLALGAALSMSVLTVTPSALAAGQSTTVSTHNAAAAASQGATNPRARTVTLLTGDKVTVTPGGSGPDAVDVKGPDGQPAAARISRQGDDIFVYPKDADSYVASGLLDANLFNVTQLIADSYDDAHSDGLPLIVTHRANTVGRRLAAVPLPEGSTDARPLPSINATALTAARGKAQDFWSSLTAGASAPAVGLDAAKAAVLAPALSGDIKKVWLDGKVKADLADSTAQIGAPEVWGKGNTGKGVDVVVLDSGYDPGHPDLKDTVTSSQSFVPGEDITDHLGHGTHVASTIAGSGAASEGKEKGVAPGASLHVGKVLSDGGTGQDSWIIAGMEWAARDVKAKVISMSLGSELPTDGTDPMSQAVNELSEETGTLFTIAAGNMGERGDHTVGAPGAASDALTVGAVDANDVAAYFTSRGPRLRDDAIKPEVAAPGVDILAAHSQYDNTVDPGPYRLMSGTSMATPHVAGAAALVAATHPDWTGAQIKDALVSSAVQTPANSADTVGNGRVYVPAATEGTFFATGTVDAGIHSPDTNPTGTVDKPVQWHNYGDQDVTVNLAVGSPETPKGVFTLADTRLTVPAHGTASTTVTTDLDAAGLNHRYTATISGSVDGKALTHTLVAVSTQPEWRHLRVKLTDRDGTTPIPDLTTVYFLRKGDTAVQALSSFDGMIDAVVPPGTYTVWSWAEVTGTHGPSSLGQALMNAPTVVVGTKDTDVVLDGSKLTEVKVKTPRTSASSDIFASYYRSLGDDTGTVVENEMLGFDADSLWTFQAAKPALGDMAFTARWRMQQPLLSLTAGDQSFDDLYLQPSAALPAEGAQDLPAVYAGNGAAADYTSLDVKGKVAVIQLKGLLSKSQADAAQKAGAALLVAVKNGAGRLRDGVRSPLLPVAGLSRDEGRTLISRIQASPKGSVPMHVVGHPQTQYLYDLTHTWNGSVPKQPEYAPKERELGQVNVDFRNPAGGEVSEFRHDVLPYLGFTYGGARLSYAGQHRTDWVTTDQNTQWTEEADFRDNANWSIQSSDLVTYPAGKATDVQWFGPVQRPRMNRSFLLPERTGDSVSVYVPGYGDSGTNHVGTSGFGSNSQNIQLYRGDNLLAESAGPAVDAGGLPAGKNAYRLVYTNECTDCSSSTSTRTEWGFTSAEPKKAGTGQLPFVQLDYQLPTLFDGTAGRDAKLLVTPSELPGGPKASVRTDKVELSYNDGKTWEKAKLSSSSKGASTKLDAPKKAEFVSLRVHASDGQGNTVTQTILRAAGLH